MTEEKRITTEARGHVLLIGLNRPAKLNAFDPQMLAELAEAYGELERGPHRCAVLFAHGEHFTAGLDLAKVAPVVMQGGRPLPRRDDRPVRSARHRRARSRWSARCTGAASRSASSSCSPATSRIAADDTKLAQIEVKRGIFPFGGATLRLGAGLGLGQRDALAADRRRASARRRRCASVSCRRSRRAAQHLEKAIAIAETIAAQAPLGVQATLLSARNRLEKGFELAAQELVPQARALMQTEDAREGMMSFIERRTAKFEGR